MSQVRGEIYDSRRLFGALTQASVAQFSYTTRRLGDVPELVRSYALLKKACALANRDLGVMDEAIASAISKAADEVAGGLHPHQFPVALVLGGGGTTANMNVNEVLAARATEISGLTVHPNDHVNASQSSNDTFPTAMALVVLAYGAETLTALATLVEQLRVKKAESEGVRYLGRTCLQDAVEVMASQTLGAQAIAVDRMTADLERALDRLRWLPLGATVLGTGVGAPDGYGQRVLAHLQREVRNPLHVSTDLFDSLAHLDPYAAVADALARTAMLIAKISNDLRLRASGPLGGFAEITIPRLQPGSSIMPAKVNPVVPEYAIQLSFRVRGNAQTVGMAVAAGELELNVMEPVILDALLNCMDDVRESARALANLCIAGMTWDGPRRLLNLDGALDRWVVLAADAGYDRATAALGEARGAASNDGRSD